MSSADAQGLPLDLSLDPEGWSALAVGHDGSFGLARSPIDGRVDVLYYSPSAELRWRKEISHTGHAEDLRINAAGNLLVAWGIGVRDSYRVLLKRISPAGDLLLPAPVQASADSTECRFEHTLLAVREDGSFYVAWYEEETERKIMLQRISADGSRLWPADVQVNGPSEFSRYRFGLRVTSGGVALLWWHGLPFRRSLI